MQSLHYSFNPEFKIAFRCLFNSYFFFLFSKVTVKDENGRVYEFPCKEWLSETQGGGKTERLLRLQHS